MSSTSLSKPQGKKKELLALAAANGVGEPSMARWLRELLMADFLRSPGKMMMLLQRPQGQG